MSSGAFAPPGAPCAAPELETEEGRQFAAFLERSGPETFTKLLEVRRQAKPGADVVVFRTQTGRPQRCVHPIRKEEVIAAVFPDNGSRPKVLALRRDFPLTPHLNLEDEEFPRSLCLYEESYQLVRLSWTPAAFLERVRLWLRKTATGTLHAADQPLEPLIAHSAVHFIFPPGILAEQNSKHLQVIRDVQSGETRTIISTWAGDGKAESPETHAVQIAVFKTPPQPHGIVRRAPKNLAELDALTSVAGLPLIRQLWQKLATWHTAGVLAQVAKRELLLMVELPKTRNSGGSPETHEYRAFLLEMNVHQVAHLLGVLSRKPGKAVTEFKIPAGVPEQLKVQLCQTHCSLSATLAAEVNGVPACDKGVVAIGAGAMGSQVVMNLARAGWGGWVVIDPDVLFPHNLARHALDGYSVGFYKAAGLAHAVDSLYPNVRRILGVPDDVLSPKLAATNEFLAKAELILDFSASVPVARHLARQKKHARTLSAFVSPKGDCFVLLAEDSERKVRLDWLEMLHYRAVLNNTALGETLQSRDERYRYGGGCRDISAVLAQEDLALWAGAAARAIRKRDECADAAIRIYVRHDDGAVTVHTTPVTAPKQIQLTDAETRLQWTIQLDQWLLDKLARHRRERLPNETGGILLGNFDTQAKVCSIVDMIASPPDSIEWPTSYIRGCEGLTAAVQEVQRRTAHQLTYVGEWHSHPDRCSTRPSGDDLQAYAWLLAQMKLEALPAVMLIVGESGEYRLVAAI